jgi:tetratricopeptide (TPR) repeat protein
MHVRERALPVSPAAVTSAADAEPGIRDDTWLFHAASDAERDGDAAAARGYYEELLRAMPESELADAARFNLGLVLEHGGDYAAAAEVYAPIIAKPMPADDAQRTWLDAHFRRAACLAKAGGWAEVSRLFDIVLAVPGLAAADRIEALVGRGIADEERGALAAAEIAFSHVLHLARDLGRDSGLGPFAAEAAFHWAEIERGKFEGVALAFPNALLAERLDEKCERLLTAQRRYLRAMHFGDAHTVAAAGNRIGGMYERLYDDIMALDVPADFDAEQREVYRDEVRRRLRVLVEKAIRVYERTALIGKRADSAAPWVEKSEAALARLRAIVVNEPAL